MSQPGYPPPPSPYQPPVPPIPQPPPSAPQPPVPRERRRYSYLAAIVLAPFSKELWRDVGQRWRGIGLLYLFLLLLLTWIVVGIKWQVGFVRLVNHEAPKLVQQVPPITITNGVVSAQVKQPHTIKDPDTGQPLAIIDTTGQVTQLPPKVYLLLTRDALIMRQKPNQIRTQDLSNFTSFRIDQQRINDWLYAGKIWGVPLLIAALIVLSFIWRLALMLLFGAIALAIASGLGARIAFPAAMRLAAISMTPAILLSTIWTLVGLPSLGCFDLLIPIGITIVYLLLTVKANAPDAITPGGFEVTTPRANPF